VVGERREMALVPRQDFVACTGAVGIKVNGSLTVVIFSGSLDDKTVRPAGKHHGITSALIMAWYSQITVDLSKKKKKGILK
jgi:hypothetical protein